MTPELHHPHGKAAAGSGTPTAQVDGPAVESLLARFQSVRRTTEEWTSALEPGDFVLQSMPDASPIGWHLAHTTWFFEEFLLGPFDQGYQRFHPRFQFLFNSYYEAVGARVARHQRGMLSRPGVEVIRRYRASVTEAVVELLPRLRGAEQERAISIIEIGLQHEQQHQELMVTDLKHAFSLNPLRPAIVAQGPAIVATGAASSGSQERDSELSFHAYREGLYDIGVDASSTFSFDNEGPAHRVYLGAFELADRAVTCGEWMQFMEAGGYREAAHWLSAGWARIHALDDPVQAPLYWEQRDGEWWHFTASGDRPVDPHQTVTHISYYEADAYARWRGCRLPTEFEWEAAAVAAGHSPARAGRFRDSLRFEPGSPGAGPEGTSAVPGQLFGDVWEWTSSAYAAYPRYAPDAGALGEYNGKFMSGQFVLRGGSCATPESHIRPTYRNFFPADARWQFSGLRLARDSQN